MFRRKVAFAVLGVLIFGVLIFLLWPSSQKPQVEFDAGDGTSFTLVGVTYGTTLQFYEGSKWQKVMYSIFGANIPEVFRGYQSYMASVDTNGALALRFKHFRKNGVLPLPAYYPGGFVQLAPSGNKAADIQPSGEFKLPIGTNSQPAEEYVIFEFPLSREREIHFRSYRANEQGLVLSTNDFTIGNPAFK
jgi:hypothetical protein